MSRRMLTDLTFSLTDSPLTDGDDIHEGFSKVPQLIVPVLAPLLQSPLSYSHFLRISLAPNLL